MTRSTRAVALEQNFALGHVEIEGAALVAGAAHGLVGGIERLENGIHQRIGKLVGAARDGELRLFVAEFCRRAHHHAMKRVRALAAVGADDHAHREGRAVLVGSQRTKIVGNALRQHRHDAIGKIYRVAAADRFAIQRRARPHVMRHVGDCDGDEMPAGIARVGIRNRVHRVVVILGVGRIDGDERHLSPIFAPRQRRRLRRVGFIEERAGKNVRDVVGMDCDQADGALALDRAQSFNDRAHWQTELAIARHLHGNEIAIDGAQGAIGRDRHLAAELFLVDRHQPAAAPGQSAKNTEHAMLGAVQKFYDARGGFVLAALFDAQQRAVADAGDFARARPARHDDADDRRRAVGGLVPFGRPRQ